MPDPFGMAIALKIALRSAPCPTHSGGPETGTQVAHHVELPRTILALPLVDGIVFILEIPIVDDGHQHPQAVPLARARKRIVHPFPRADFLFVLHASI